MKCPLCQTPILKIAIHPGNNPMQLCSLCLRASKTRIPHEIPLTIEPLTKETEEQIRKQQEHAARTKDASFGQY